MGGEEIVGNITPRAGFERTHLAFEASMLAIILLRIPDVTTLPMPTCSPSPEMTHLLGIVSI